MISIIAAVDPLSMFAQLWLMLLKCLFQFDLLDHVFAVAVCKLAASLSKVPFVISENPSLLALTVNDRLYRANEELDQTQSH